MEIYHLSLEIENLKREKERMKIELHDLQNNLESFKQKNRNEQKDFLLFQDMKNELEKNNISIQDLESLINVIRIFKDDYNFQPIKIMYEFSDVQKYRYQRDNKNRELNELDSKIQRSKSLYDKYKQYIAQYQLKESALTDLENMEFNLSDLKKLYLVLQEIAERYRTDKKEVKIKFFKFLNKFNDRFGLDKEMKEKLDKNSALYDEILSRRKIIKAQPEVFSVLKRLLESGFNEDNILSVFKIIKKDYLNKIPFDNETYLECLSKELDRYKSIKDTLKSLDIEKLMSKSQVDKLSAYKSNLESFIYSSVLSIYFYSILLKIQKVQIQIKFTEIFSIQYVMLFIYFYAISIWLKKIQSVQEKIKSKKKQTNKQTKKGKMFKRKKRINKKNSLCNGFNG
jgi:hypothetical protein